jgi:hypothetical protein
VLWLECSCPSKSHAETVFNTIASSGGAWGGDSPQGLLLCEWHWGPYKRPAQGIWPCLGLLPLPCEDASKWHLHLGLPSL